MNDSRLSLLAEKLWEHRKKFGYLTKVPAELQSEAVDLHLSGFSGYQISKALGITRSSLSEWKKKFSESPASEFKEVSVNMSDSSRSISHEVKLTAEIKGCRVTLSGQDYSLLRRLLARIES